MFCHTPLFYGKKGQSGIEYLIVVGIGLLILIPVFVVGQRSIADFDTNADQLLAKQALNKIEEAANLVYAQGEPAKITLDLRFPNNINSTKIQNKLMIITIRSTGQTSDLISIVNFPINGTIPTTSGKKKVSIEAKTNFTGEVYVEVSHS